jgi:hypothetical protein
MRHDAGISAKTLVEDGPRSEVWSPTTAAHVNFPAVLAPQKFGKFGKFGKFD